MKCLALKWIRDWDGFKECKTELNDFPHNVSVEHQRVYINTLLK
jgi:hypothetical protein